MGIVGNALDRFMNLTNKLRFFFGPATQGDTGAPVIHKHDDFERASEQELGRFDVESDSGGHHYAVRKADEAA